MYKRQYLNSEPSRWPHAVQTTTRVLRLRKTPITAETFYCNPSGGTFLLLSPPRLHIKLSSTFLITLCGFKEAGRTDTKAPVLPLFCGDTKVPLVGHDAVQVNLDARERVKMAGDLCAVVLLVGIFMMVNL